MSDPYRSHLGAKCPRCEAALTRESDSTLTCGTGCGTWIPNSVLPLRPASLMEISRPSPTQASPLPFSRCPACSLSLTDLYAGAEDVLVIGQCLEHGVWIERGHPAVLEATFAAEIARQATEIASPENVERSPEPVVTSPRTSPQTALAPGVADLMKRVSSLERTVEDLYRKLASLRSTVDQLK